MRVSRLSHPTSARPPSGGRRRWLRMSLAPLAGVAALPAAAVASSGPSPVMRFEARAAGEAVEIDALARWDGDVGRAWRALTDYGAYPRFIPDLSESRVVSRDGGRVVLEQSGALRFLWWSTPLTVRLSVVEHAPDRVESDLLEGSVRGLRGRYALRADGREVELHYSGRIVPDARSRTGLEVAAIRAGALRQFEALVRELARNGLGAAGSAPGG